MNHSLKHWKEAATLIVAAEQRLCAGAVTSRTPPPHATSNYNILLLKRSGRSSFMPNAYVFPGGLVDPTDFSSEWLDIFKKFSNSPNFGEVAFRICALRETFEESGVLLVVPKNEEERVFRSTEVTVNESITDICPDELTKWRSLVNQNPSNFIRMCRELEVLPNIWALHEWSNWLTPEGRYGGRRFDTAFFICCLKEIPHTLQDQKEIELFQWSPASEVLQSYKAEEFWIAPPQFYELSRLCRLPSLDALHTFASERAVEGCERWLPFATVENGQPVSLLPGDKHYPGDVFESSSGHDRDSALHRFVIEGSYDIRLQINITPKYKHLLPVLPPSSKSLL
ncbi:unnamed protein product [Knipowitschia caucasica]|uniref:Acyl-coenzyme A diphosphatase NUDT19 n=1 Tax=Knipowitschia caucasica TaxID=637954 RepID=A0AAV2LTP7_KNICA